MRLDLASHEAISKELIIKSDSNGDTRQQLKIEMNKREIDRQNELLSSTKNNLDRIRQLATAGSVSPGELAEVQLTFKNAQFDLEKEHLNLELLKQEIAGENAAELVSVRRKIAGLNAREKAAQKFLAQLNSAATSSRLINRIDEQMAFAQKELLELRRETLETESEIREKESFIEIINSELESMKEAAPKTDAQENNGKEHELP